MSFEEHIAFGETFCVVPPTYEEWMARRNTFSDFGRKYYFSLGKVNPPEKFRVLERELERCYCSQAHLACIILAAAIVEIFKTDISSDARKELDSRLEYIASEVQWLKNMRNDIMHFIRAPEGVTFDDYTTRRGELEGLSRQACSIVYHVARAYVGLDPNTAFQGTLRDKAAQSP